MTMRLHQYLLIVGAAFFLYTLYDEILSVSLSPLPQTDNQTSEQSEEENIQAKVPSTDSDQRVRIAHIVNFYACEECPEQFRPLDQAQNVTIGSMKQAILFSKKSLPTVYVALYDQDANVAPNDFVVLSNRLNRTTSSEYPDLQPQRTLPFLDDILSSLYDSSNVQPFDYVVYTNSDIALQYDFYDRVAHLISEGYDGFAVNRRTLPKDDKNGIPYSSSDLHLLYNMTGEEHPGTDCIVFKSDLYRKYFDLGNVFLGYPPIGNVMKALVEAHSKTYHWFKTFETNKMTFHLGSDRKWKDLTKPRGAAEAQIVNEENGRKVLAKYGRPHQKVPQS